jgi:hypothetical protein
MFLRTVLKRGAEQIYLAEILGFNEKYFKPDEARTSSHCSDTQRRPERDFKTKLFGGPW